MKAEEMKTKNYQESNTFTRLYQIINDNKAIKNESNEW